MFTQNHPKEINNILRSNIEKLISLRVTALEKAYKKNPHVADAKVSANGENIDISIKLNFTPKDEEQNIPLVLEYGGVIFDEEDVPHMIEPGFYTRRIMAQGAEK